MAARSTAAPVGLRMRAYSLQRRAGAVSRTACAVVAATRTATLLQHLEATCRAASARAARDAPACAMRAGRVPVHRAGLAVRSAWRGRCTRPSRCFARHSIVATRCCGRLPQPLLEVLSASATRRRLADRPTAVHAAGAVLAASTRWPLLWTSWGVQPAAVMGHSVGEFVAAGGRACSASKTR